MNLHRKVFPTLFFISLLVSSVEAWCSQSFIIFRDLSQVGDGNQAQGVFQAYQHLVPDVVKVEVSLADKDKLESVVEKAVETSSKKPIVLAVGEKTVVPFAEQLPLKGAITVHLCHMVTAGHDKLLGKADYVAIPVHAAANLSKVSKTKLIETVGVAHNRQIPEIEQIYKADKEKLPKSDQYLGVILAGDAPTPENKILLFTEDNAQQLARYISSVLQKRHLLITNGPRTGKYDPKTLQEDKTVHREGKSDSVTLAFLDELKRSGVDKSQYTLFDFQYGSKSHDMDLVLGAVRATKSEILVPGESTSSISESIDALPHKAVVVYESTSMNKVHEAHVKSELDAGRIRRLDAGFQQAQGSKTEKELPPKQSAADTIATVLFKQSN